MLRFSLSVANGLRRAATSPSEWTAGPSAFLPKVVVSSRNFATGAKDGPRKPKSFLPRDPRVSAKRGVTPIDVTKQRERERRPFPTKELPSRQPQAPRPAEEDELEPPSTRSPFEHIISGDDLKSCVGCGATIQTDNPLELGFVPPHKFLEYFHWRQAVSGSLGLSPPSNPEGELTDFTLGDLLSDNSAPAPAETASNLSASLAQLVASSPLPAPESIDPKQPKRLTCQRCFELEHYGRVTPAAIDASQFAEIVKPIRDTNALVVNVVDIFDFHGSFIPTLRKFSGSNPVILAANKLDLLPEGAHEERVKAWLHKEAKALGSSVVSVQLFSARTGAGIDQLASAIEWYRAGRPEVFVMGCANVGKSTLINKLMAKFRGPKQRKVTVSSVPGTTLNLIRLPLGEDAWLYDTPGIFSNTQILRYLNEEELKKITPQKQLKPVVQRINPGKTIFIAGLARMDYLSGPDGIFFTFFTSNELYLHKTLTEKADALYAAKRGSMLDPPSFANKKLPPLKSYYFEFDNTGGPADRAYVDVTLAGLGWFSITGRGKVTLKVWFPEGCAVKSRDPLMPFESIRGLKPNPRENMKPFLEQGDVHIFDPSPAPTTLPEDVETAAQESK